MKFFVVLAFCLAVASATPFPQGNEESLIANGRNAARGQFPYQVGLSVNMGSRTTFCGGSLINPEWILTAAHCASGAQSITAYFGGTVRKQAAVTRSIGQSNMVVHDGWNMQKLKNDIALLNIVAVPLSSDIHIVKLPARGATNSYVNSWTIASGWGLFTDSERRFANNLQYGRMKVVETGQCASFYGSEFSIGPNTLCVATPDHTSPCNGDSGGPLVLESSDRAGFKVQIGVISYGSESGCEQGFPVVFTRVSSYLDWIRRYSGVSS